MSTPPRRDGSSRLGSLLLAAVSLAAAVVGAGVLGPLVAAGALVWLVVYTLRRVGADPPPFPAPRFTLAWLLAAVRYLGELVAWAAPYVPFLAPTIAFVAVTRPLPSETATLGFQEQAAQIIPVLLIGYVIEAGAIRWRARPVDWLLSLVTVALLIAGETYALVAIANDDPVHADIVAGAMAAGVVAILTAAAQGAGGAEHGKDEKRINRPSEL
ncbi:MAG: hypothetical protein ABW065_05305 [Solirubrobacterales bacterium]